MRRRLYKAVILTTIFSFPYLNYIIGYSPESEHMGDIVSLRMQGTSMRLMGQSDEPEIPTMRPLPEGNYSGSSFGMRVHPILHRRKLHTGIDFAAPKGTPVLATANGRIKKVINRSGSSTYGKHILIEHPASEYLDEHYSTMYAHLSKTLVKPGEWVTAGDTIGLVGNTGRSTGFHLHYEVRRNGREVNPAEFFLLVEGDSEYSELSAGM